MMIRQPIYHGHVNASGIFFPSLSNEMNEELARFILTFWQYDIRLYHVAKGWILLFKHMQVMNADRCRGYPLVKQAMGFSSAPLDKVQIVEIGMESDSVVLVQGQQIEHFICSSTYAVDLSDWVDISAYSLLEAEHLGQDQPKALVQVAESVSKATGRAIFGEAEYGSSQQAAEKLKNLQQQASKHQHQQQGTSSVLFNLALIIMVVILIALVMMTAVAASSLILIAIIALITGALFPLVIKALYAKGSSTAKYNEHDQQSAQSSQTQTPAQQQNSWRATKPRQHKSASAAWMQRLFGNWLMSSQLGKVLGRQQAKYLQKVQTMFEQNNLQEALKHAIPLSDVNSLFQTQQPSPFFGKLGARERLDITTQQNTGSSSVAIGESYEALLRRMYRQAFHRLDRQKKVKDAAFVLAELLRETDEAVNYLERHQQYTLAAKLAEGRLLDPAIVVRLWVIQGDFERATVIARQTGCYEAAVKLLEQKPQDKANDAAKKLRISWAVSLAKAGDYAKACEVIWPLIGSKTPHELASDWIDWAMLAEGETAARLLPYKLVLHPESYPQMMERVQDLISSNEADSHQQQRVMIDVLMKLDKTPELQSLASCLSRSYLTDCATGKARWSKRRFKQLTIIGDDAVLRYDAKKLDFPLPSQAKKNHLAEEKHIQLDLQGTGAICGIKPLENNRYLIAHGEAGVSLCRADGSIQRRFNVPAMQLVIADLHNRAIAIAHRGKANSLTKLDLVTGKIEPWKESYFTQMTESYDGDAWLVADDNRVYAMDMFSPELTAIWQITDLPTQVFYLQRTPQALNILMAKEHEAEYWRYELPSLTLRERQPIKQEVLEQVDFLDLNAKGHMAFIRVEAQPETQTMVVGIKDITTSLYQETFALEGLQPQSIHFDEERILIRLTAEGITEFWLVDKNCQNKTKGRILVMRVSALSDVQARIVADQLVVYSADGGVAVVDVNDGLVGDRFSV